MNRRSFIGALGGAATGPLAARGQQSRERMHRIGVLMPGTATEAVPQSYVAAFGLGLRQLGWVEGQNIRVDIRWNAGDAGLARIYAAQLIGLMPDVIVAASTTNLIAIREATSTLPIIFLSVSDPVAQGFVSSLTKPGGNISGFSTLEFSIAGKWLELLKEIASGLTRVGVLFNPDTSPQSEFFMRSVEAGAALLGVKPMAIPIHSTGEIEPAIERFAQQPHGGLILPTDTFTRLRQGVITELAARYRLPSISAYADFPREGGLIYYGVIINVAEQYRYAAGYVDRILRGTKPGDLPVQAPTKYELVINLKTAKTLGLTVPDKLLAVADDLIE